MSVDSEAKSSMANDVNIFGQSNEMMFENQTLI